MLYLTFRPAKGSVIVPKLVKCLCVATDAFFILLAAWTIVNMCYPFWGWTNYRSIWVGFFTVIPLYMLLEHLSLRSFMTAEYRYNDLCYSGGRLKHLGFLFSVWHRSDALILGRYHESDRLVCRQERGINLGNEIELNKWLGWPLVLITDTIPLILLAAVFSAGYFFGISVFVFYLMGSSLAVNLVTVSRYPLKMDPWDDEMSFFEGKIYPKRHVGIVTCILEGSDGELVLSMIEVAVFSHYAKRIWFETAAWACRRCISMMEPIRLGYSRICRPQSV